MKQRFFKQIVPFSLALFFIATAALGLYVAAENLGSPKGNLRQHRENSWGAPLFSGENIVLYPWNQIEEGGAINVATQMDADRFSVLQEELLLVLLNLAPYAAPADFSAFLPVLWNNPKGDFYYVKDYVFAGPSDWKYRTSIVLKGNGEGSPQQQEPMEYELVYFECSYAKTPIPSRDDFDEANQALGRLLGEREREQVASIPSDGQLDAVTPPPMEHFSNPLESYLAAMFELQEKLWCFPKNLAEITWDEDITERIALDRYLAIPFSSTPLVLLYEPTQRRIEGFSLQPSS